ADAEMPQRRIAPQPVVTVTSMTAPPPAAPAPRPAAAKAKAKQLTASAPPPPPRTPANQDQQPATRAAIAQNVPTQLPSTSDSAGPIPELVAALDPSDPG